MTHQEVRPEVALVADGTFMASVTLVEVGDHGVIISRQGVHRGGFGTEALALEGSVAIIAEMLGSSHLVHSTDDRRICQEDRFCPDCQKYRCTIEDECVECGADT